MWGGGGDVCVPSMFTDIRPARFLPYKATDSITDLESPPDTPVSKRLLKQRKEKRLLMFFLKHIQT